MARTNSCEVCGFSSPQIVLDLGFHPLCDDLKHVSSDHVCKEYPIQITFCPSCKTAFQAHQVPKHDLFPSSYHYRSRFTADVLSGMRDLVTSVKSIDGSLRGKSVLDIGCNDGSLLNYFRKEGALTYGIEPTSASADAIEQGHDVICDYLTPKLAARFVKINGFPDIITFTNVFAHIEDLPELLDSLRYLMGDSTYLVIENHYLGSVLDKYQFDTFYHEHPRTYSATSFLYVANCLSRSILRLQFPERYGGNIRVIIGPRDQASNSSNVLDSDICEIENHFESRLNLMASQIPVWVTEKKQHIRQLVSKYGPLRAKAFPGRAAILIKLLKLDVDSIKCCYEKPGSMKTDHFLPGTKVPILSDDMFDPADETPVLNLAWHISSEIESYMRRLGFHGPIIDILSSSDFTS
jgi:hypothetical protein